MPVIRSPRFRPQRIIVEWDESPDLEAGRAVIEASPDDVPGVEVTGSSSADTLQFLADLTDLVAPAATFVTCGKPVRLSSPNEDVNGPCALEAGHSSPCLAVAP